MYKNNLFSPEHVLFFLTLQNELISYKNNICKYHLQLKYHVLFQVNNGINYPIKNLNIKICTSNEPQSAQETHILFFIEI